MVIECCRENLALTALHPAHLSHSALVPVSRSRTRQALPLRCDSLVIAPRFCLL